MRIMERLTRWMETNLERPFYEAEIARIQALRVDERNCGFRTVDRIKHKKVALKIVK